MSAKNSPCKLVVPAKSSLAPLSHQRLLSVELLQVCERLEFLNQVPQTIELTGVEFGSLNLAAELIKLARQYLGDAPLALAKVKLCPKIVGALSVLTEVGVNFLELQYHNDQSSLGLLRQGAHEFSRGGVSEFGISFQFGDSGRTLSRFREELCALAELSPTYIKVEPCLNFSKWPLFTKSAYSYALSENLYQTFCASLDALGYDKLHTDFFVRRNTNTRTAFVPPPNCTIFGIGPSAKSRIVEGPGLIREEINFPDEAYELAILTGKPYKKVERYLQPREHALDMLLYLLASGPGLAADDFSALFKTDLRESAEYFFSSLVESEYLDEEASTYKFTYKGFLARDLLFKELELAPCWGGEIAGW